PIDPVAIDPTKNGMQLEHTTNPNAMAPMLFMTAPLDAKDRPVAGVSVVAPYAALVSFHPDRPQRIQLPKAPIVTVHVTASLAYRAHERFSLGAGVSYGIGLAELSRVQDVATLSDVGAALAREPISQANDFGPDAPTGVRELDVMARPFT